MAIDFSKFKTDPNASKSRLQKTIDNSSSKSGFAKDENVWKPSVDKDGNGSAMIRFIYDPKEIDFVELRNHGIKRQGKWFIDNCPKTIDWEQPCPACEHAESLKNDRQWNKVPEAEQNKIRPFFSKVSYWTNIQVIKDPTAPENEGKIFKYRFGKKIADKIEKAMVEDPLDGTPGFSAYDPFNGANFKLSIKRVSGFQNYDDSKFAEPSEWLNGDTEEMLRITEEEGHDLSTIVSNDQFKPYEELSKKFNRFMGIKPPAGGPAKDVEIPENDTKVDAGPTPEAEAKKTKKAEEKQSADPTEGAVDDDFFENLIDSM